MSKVINLTKENRMQWAARLVGLRHKYEAESKKQFSQNEWEQWLVDNHGLKFIYKEGGIAGVKFTTDESEFIFALKW